MISIHEYQLRPDADVEAFESAILQARAGGLLELTGLVSCHFGRGVKGARDDKYVALWIYESREAWERIWGTPDQPRGFEEYPEDWRVWETEVLAPFLDRDPDKIEYTTYEILGENQDEPNTSS